MRFSCEKVYNKLTCSSKGKRPPPLISWDPQGTPTQETPPHLLVIPYQETPIPSLPLSSLLSSPPSLILWTVWLSDSIASQYINSYPLLSVWTFDLRFRLTQCTWASARWQHPDLCLDWRFESPVKVTLGRVCCKADKCSTEEVV